MGLKDAFLQMLLGASPPPQPQASPLMRLLLSIEPWDVTIKTGIALVLNALVWAICMWGLAPR
jgi:hypothetical protein